jgi:hypothetical protein
MKKDNSKGIAYYQNLRLKYLNNAKEASSLGDRVLAEYNLQYAEHYGRVITSKTAQIQQPQQKQVQEETDCTNASNSEQESAIIDSAADIGTESTISSTATPSKKAKKKKTPQTTQGEETVS